MSTKARFSQAAAANMLAELGKLKFAGGHTKDFIDDVVISYTSYGHLTSKQINEIAKLFNIHCLPHNKYS